MTIRCPSCEGTAQEEFIGDDVRCRCDECGEVFEWYEQADMTDQNPEETKSTILVVDETLHDLIEKGFRGGFTRDDVVEDLTLARNALAKIATSTSKAKAQLGILADMLDDNRGPVSPESAKWFASEIRKYVEWMP